MQSEFVFGARHAAAAIMRYEPQASVVAAGDLQLQAEAVAVIVTWIQAVRDDT